MCLIKKNLCYLIQLHTKSNLNMKRKPASQLKTKLQPKLELKWYVQIET